MRAFLKLKIATNNILNSLSELKNLGYKTSKKKNFLEYYKMLSENVDDLILVVDTNQNLKFVEETCQHFVQTN